jgi:hypothetical protein
MSMSTTSGLLLEYCAHGLGTVGCLRHYGYSGLGKDHPESSADQGLIVGDHDPRRSG